MNLKTMLVILIITNLIAACSSGTQTEQSTINAINEKFEDFYTRFYSDTVFQKSRVKFPLPGFNFDAHHPDSASSDTNYYWQKEDWVFINTIEGDSLVIGVEIYRKKLIVDDEKATEQLFIENAGFLVENIFEKIDGKWYLVFMYDASSR